MRLSIEEVIHTLFEAVLLVVLVVYLFLQNFRSTIICTVAIFVSLIGTFCGMLALGFSINLLTFFGIVLAIGMVVDDAIVVVENVESNMAKVGLPPKKATDKGHGGDRRLTCSRGPGNGFGFHPGRLPSRHHRPALQAVRHHHRHFGGPFRVRGADAYTGHVRNHAEALASAQKRVRSPGSTGMFDRFTLAFGDAVVFMIKRMTVAFVLLAVMIWGSGAPVPDYSRRALCQTRTRAM